MDELIGQFKKKMTALIGQKEKNMKKLRLSLVNWNRDDSSHWIFDKKMTALPSQLETTEALNGQCQLEKRWQILLVN